MNNKKLISIILISSLVICAISAVSAYTGTGFSHNISSYKYTSQSESDILNKYNDTSCRIEESGICTKVVDGDTIYVEGVGKVRFVGVNTPEKGVEGAQTSKYFTQKFCLNKRVGLDIDDRKNEDRYGRKLAVVIVNGKNLNEMLLKEGLAEVMYIPPSEFVPYDWTNENTPSHTTQKTSSTSSSSSSVSSSSSGAYIGSANSNKFHYPSCKWGKKITDNNKIIFSSRNEAINMGYQPCKVCSP